MVTIISLAASNSTRTMECFIIISIQKFAILKTYVYFSYQNIDNLKSIFVDNNIYNYLIITKVLNMNINYQSMFILLPLVII